jgi:histidine triad (HIT) family protein
LIESLLAMSSDPECIFCKVIAGRIPAATVLETDRVIAFLDINPVAPGHVLLVPKDHCSTIQDSSPESIASAAAELPRLARAVIDATGAAGLNILQNNGREAGQLIDHVHFHLIPRQPDGSFKIPWLAGKYEGTDMELMRARIRQSLV